MRLYYDMQVEFLKSSSVLVRDRNTEVLCDPWLIDGAYYGSWAHYPPVDFEIHEYDDVDYIFVSHIHPDHIQNETFEKLDDDIPVIIHDFQFDFLKNNIRRMGFDVIELPHNERTHIKDDLHINILAADNCNPEACGSYFGCDWLDDSTDGYGSSQIDTMVVFDNGHQTVVNTNDCPFELSKPAATNLLDRYEYIDHLLVSFAGAGPYPQCFDHLTKEEKVSEAIKKKEKFIKQTENYINLFEPDYFTLFAGIYVLQGRLAELNRYRGVPTRKEAADYIHQSDTVDTSEHKCVLLNSQSIFDISTGNVSESFTPVNKEWLENYIQEELHEREYRYESEDFPSVAELQKWVPDAYERMERKRQKIGFETDMDVIIDLYEGECAKVSMQGDGFEFMTTGEATQSGPYVKYDVDPRLLNWILQGPKYAHWNNAEIGSHITFERRPDRFERGLYYSMNFFHV